MTGSKVRQIAYDYAVKNGNNKFSVAKVSVGHYWLQSFMARHRLSLKKPEALSVGRASGMNKTVVSNWFDDLEKLVYELNIKGVAGPFWNCDETGLQEHFVQGRVIAETGQPCYQITSREKGETTTVLACFNACGEYCPPTVIFKGKRLKSEWVVGSPPGTLVRMSDNGWITKEIFPEWAKSFVNCLPRDDPRAHVLFLDGHSSHIYNMKQKFKFKGNSRIPELHIRQVTHMFEVTWGYMQAVSM